MIEPQNSRPGVIGEQHGLTRLTQTLEALERGQRAQAERDAQVQTQLTTQTQALAQLQAQMQAMARLQRRTQWLLLALCGLAGLALAFLLVG